MADLAAAGVAFRVAALSAGLDGLDFDDVAGPDAAAFVPVALAAVACDAVAFAAVAFAALPFAALPFAAVAFVPVALAAVAFAATAFAGADLTAAADRVGDGFGDGRTLPVAVRLVARAAATVGFAFEASIPAAECFLATTDDLSPRVRTNE